MVAINPATTTDPTGHIAALSAIKARRKAHKAMSQRTASHVAKAPGAPRKRAPKVSRVPTEVQPGDIAGRLRQKGYKAATGVSYLCDYVELGGPGTSYGVSLPMRGSATQTINKLRRALANSAMEGEDVSIWMDPDDCRLLLYWPHPEEEMPPYRSLFGMNSLNMRGDMMVVPYSAFPANVVTDAHRLQAIHMDHVLTRNHSSIWIEATCDSLQSVVIVTRITDTYRTGNTMSLPAQRSRGPVAPMELEVIVKPGQHGQVVASAVIPQSSRQLVGARELVMHVPEEAAGLAIARLRLLGECLANCSISAMAPRKPVQVYDFALPY